MRPGSALAAMGIALACAASLAAAPAAEAPAKPVPVIFDADMDSDCDDLGALAVLHALADRGEARILAVITTTDDPHTPSCADAVNTWYGRGDVPIGVLDPASGGGRSRSRYAKAVAEACPHDLAAYADAEDAVRLYRRTLAAQPDGSVVLVTVGHLTSLARLLDSKPDAASPLGGIALVARKVRLWSCMGGKYPEGKEPNFYRPDPAATVRCVRAWPTRVLFSGAEIGNAVKTGARLVETPPANPVRIGYEAYFGKPGRDRASWDQTAVLAAVRNPSAYWDLETTGHCHVEPDGRNAWRREPDKAHAYLKPKMDPKQVARVIESLMIRPPARPSD
ncbi:MAG: nucleoside hydrolase [Phycisphaerae bacterium]